jgi:hypothetical protein
VTAAAVVADARARGVQLRADGTLLRVRWPGRQAIPELREALATYKREILRLLDNQAAECCTECGRPVWLSLIAEDSGRTCSDCLTGRTALRARRVPI